MKFGRDAQDLAMNCRRPRHGLQSGADRVAPMELSRIPHSRFGSCAYDPVSGIKFDVVMKDEDTEVEVAVRPQTILAARDRETDSEIEMLRN